MVNSDAYTRQVISHAAARIAYTSIRNETTTLTNSEKSTGCILKLKDCFIGYLISFNLEAIEERFDQTIVHALVKNRALSKHVE
jgi:hypothetical protein